MGGLRDGAHHGVRETDEELLVRNGRGLLAAARSFAVAAVEKKQINVRAVIQFIAAQLAQRENAETAAHDAALRVAILRMAIALDQFLVAERQGVGEDYVREHRELESGFAQR
jgi:uncharacterized membrane-anchored protein